MAKTTKKVAPPESSVKGVSYRTDGFNRWQVRIRKMVAGNLHQYPIQHYPVDLDAPLGSPTHIETARIEAENRANALWAKLKDDLKAWSQAPHHYTLRGVLERYQHEINEGRITTHEALNVRKASGEVIPKDVYVRKNIIREVSAISCFLGTAKTGNNTKGFPELTDKYLHQLTFDDFFSMGETKAFNHQLKGAKGQTAPNGSVKRILSSIRTIINHAIKVWRIPLHNPLATLSGIPINDKRERTMSDEEWNAINKRLDETKTDDATKAAIRFARFTAARRGEVVKLDWTDINLNNKTAKFRETKSKDGKTESREAPLNIKAMSLINELLNERDIATLTGPIFVSSRKQRLRSDTVTQAWGRARAEVSNTPELSKISEVRVHDLRHTRITELGQFLNAAEAARVSGHKDFSTFFRYFNPDPVAIGRKIDAYEAGSAATKDIELLIMQLSQLPFEDLMFVSMTAQQRKIKSQVNSIPA